MVIVQKMIMSGYQKILQIYDAIIDAKIIIDKRIIDWAKNLK